jgi:hypothetical protein
MIKCVSSFLKVKAVQPSRKDYTGEKGKEQKKQEEQPHEDRKC